MPRGVARHSRDVAALGGSELEEPTAPRGAASYLVVDVELSSDEVFNGRDHTSILRFRHQHVQGVLHARHLAIQPVVQHVADLCNHGTLREHAAPRRDASERTMRVWWWVHAASNIRAVK